MRSHCIAWFAVLVAATPVSAQWFAPACGWGFARPVWGFSYGFSYSSLYVNPWVYAPPVVAVPLRPTPGVFTVPVVDDPLGEGVDLADLRRRMAVVQEAERRADELAKSRVKAAVDAGDLVVFEPGNPLPNRAALPPPRVIDIPKPPVVPTPTEPKALAVWHLRRGQAAFDRGEFGRATEQLAAAVKADPTLGEAHFQLAQVRVARGQYAEAMDAIRTGMNQIPTWTESRFRTDELYLAQPKRLSADAADLKAALDAKPADATLTYLYAHHLWFCGERAKAKELFASLKDVVKEKELVEPFLR